MPEITKLMLDAELDTRTVQCHEKVSATVLTSYSFA